LVQINFEVGNEAIGKEISEIIKNLDEKKKKEIAEKVVGAWLQDQMAPACEKEEFEKRLLQSMREGGCDRFGGKPFSEMTVGELRATSLYYDKMQSFKATCDVLRETIRSQIEDVIKTKVPELVRSNEALQKTILEMFEEFKKNFPQLVHDALVAWFLEKMYGMDASIARVTNDLGLLRQQIQAGTPQRPY